MVITYLVTGMQNQVESTNPGDINVTLNGHSKWNHPPKKKNSVGVLSHVGIFPRLISIDIRCWLFYFLAPINRHFVTENAANRHYLLCVPQWLNSPCCWLSRVYTIFPLVI